MLKKPRRHFLILSCFQYNLESVNWTIAFGIQLMRGRFLLSFVFFSWNIADSMTCFRHYLPIIDRQPWRLWSMLIYCDLHPFNTRKNLAARCAFGIFVSLITTIMTYSFISNRGNCHFGIAHIYLTVYKSKVPYKRSKLKEVSCLFQSGQWFWTRTTTDWTESVGYLLFTENVWFVFRRKNRQGNNRFKGKKLTLLGGNTLFLAGRIRVLHLSF